MSWSNFKNIKSGSGDILKLEDGKPYKLRIIGEPYVYESEYKGQYSTRFALGVFNQTENKPQIVMLPKSAVGQIYGLIENEDWGDPLEYDITLKRSGTGKETEYSVAPSPKKPLDESKKALVEAINIEEVLSRLPSVSKAFPLSDVVDDSVVERMFPKHNRPTEDVVADVPEGEVDLHDLFPED